MPRPRSTQLPKPELPTGLERDLQRAIAIVREVRQTLAQQTERLDQLESELRLLVDGPKPLPFPLLPRQIEVLRALARGDSNAEIAAQLGVEPSSVNAILTQLYRALAVRNRNEAALTAWKLGLI